MRRDWSESRWALKPGPIESMAMMICVAFGGGGVVVSVVSVLCGADQKEAVFRMLFAETTTLGIRSYQVERRALDRKVVKVETQYGAIDVKVARMNGHVVNEMPEFDQVQAAARQANVPFRTVDAAVRLALANSAKG